MNPTVTLPPATAAAPARAAGDFPDWLPPMLVKELRQGLRAKGFVGLFVAFHLIAIIAFWWTLELNSVAASRETFNVLNGVFWALVNLVLLLALPWRGLAGLRTEMDSRTLDLLVLTRLTAWRIVIGKWVALVAQALLFLVALLPYGVVRYFFGSVDLAADLAQAGMLLLISVTLTAATLWVSTMPKLFRVLVPILLLLVAQAVGVATFAMLFTPTGRGAGGPSRVLATMNWQAVALTAVLIVAFLGLAVRRLAPAAENHAQLARGFLLVLFAAAVVADLAVYGAPVVQVGFAATMIVCALELSRDTLPMAVHWRPWRARGRFGAAVGRLALPGWPSAALFTAVALGFLAMLAACSFAWMPPRATALGYAWWLVLAWQALVFPAVLLSFLPESSSMRLGGGGYFVVQGVFGIMSLISATNGQAIFANNAIVRALDGVCHWLPVSSFWLCADEMKSGFPVGRVVAQLPMLLLLVWLVRRQSALYWRQIAMVDAIEPKRAP